MFQICHINIEIKKRELISRLDLAIELVRRGILVILGECYDPKILLKFGSDNSYILGKCAQQDTLKKFKLLIDRGWTFGALDEEGLLPDSLNVFASQRFSPEIGNICSDYFFFGNKQKEVFDKTFGPLNSFIVSGNPRTDMWQAKCYGLYDLEIKDIKKKYGNYVLLPLNFGYYTEVLLHSLSTTGHLKNDNQVLAKKSEFLFDQFCKLAEKIAKEKKINVIMRPHPTDDPSHISKLMVKHGVRSDLVHCINTNDVFPWISAAKILFHNCCTTSIEAGFCGTPVMTFSPSNVSLLKEDCINKLFPIAQTYEEAMAELGQNSDRLFISSNFKSRIKKWDRLSLKFNGSTAGYIADSIVQRNIFEKNQKNIKLSKQVDYKRLKSEFLSKISGFLGNNQRKINLDKFPRTNKEEIVNIVNHICKYRGYKEKLSITDINSNLFGIYKN